MKVLQVNCVFGRGSTGRLVSEIHSALLRAGHESIVCYGRGAASKDKNIIKASTELEAKVHAIQSRLFGMDFAYSYFSTRKIIKIIRKEQPDIVHLHCLNGHCVNAYKLIAFLKKNKIRTILTLHAEIMHTAGCEHAFDCERWKTQCYACSKIGGKISSIFTDDVRRAYNRMKKVIAGFRELEVVGVSEWLTERARQSAILDGICCRTIYNGVDTATFYPRSFAALQAQQNLINEKIILHVTPNFYHPIKGGKYVLALAKRMPDVKFVIVGYNGKTDTLPGNVVPVPFTTGKDELAMYYTMANLTLLTSKRETFSMVCAESLCCGTPVVGFEAGAPERISIAQYSEFVPFGDMDALQEAVCKWLEYPADKEAISNTSRAKYTSQHMVDEYFNLYMGSSK